MEQKTFLVLSLAHLPPPPATTPQGPGVIIIIIIIVQVARRHFKEEAGERPALRNIIMKNKGEIEMQIQIFAINIRTGNVQKHVTEKKCITNSRQC